MKRAPLSRLTRQKGLSLVELMVAITVGLILLAGVLQIFASSQQSYRVQEATSRLQENGRFAIEFLSRDIRMAGYRSCGGSATKVTNALNGATPGVLPAAIEGFESPAPTPAVPAAPGTDTLTLRTAFGEPIPVLAGMASSTGPIPVAGNNGLTQFGIVMVSNCDRTAVLQITNANPSPVSGAAGSIEHAVGVPGNAFQDLDTTFLPDNAEVIRLRTTTYYIAPGAAGGLSLWSGANELVEGVDNMQLLYGEDTDANADGAANRYVPANAAGLDMDRVVSVRVTLTLRTLDNNVSLTAAAGDRRLRRQFATTVALRNRTP